MAGTAGPGTAFRRRSEGDGDGLDVVLRAPEWVSLPVTLSALQLD